MCSEMSGFVLIRSGSVYRRCCLLGQVSVVKGQQEFVEGILHPEAAGFLLDVKT